MMGRGRINSCLSPFSPRDGRQGDDLGRNARLLPGRPVAIHIQLRHLENDLSTGKLCARRLSGCGLAGLRSPGPIEGGRLLHERIGAVKPRAHEAADLVIFNVGTGFAVLPQIRADAFHDVHEAHLVVAQPAPVACCEPQAVPIEHVDLPAEALAREDPHVLAVMRGRDRLVVGSGGEGEPEQPAIGCGAADAGAVGPPRGHHLVAGRGDGEVVEIAGAGVDGKAALMEHAPMLDRVGLRAHLHRVVQIPLRVSLAVESLERPRGETARLVRDGSGRAVLAQHLGGKSLLSEFVAAGIEVECQTRLQGSLTSHSVISEPSLANPTNGLPPRTTERQQ